MAALSANAYRAIYGDAPSGTQFPCVVGTGETIYRGAIVGISAAPNTVIAADGSAEVVGIAMDYGTAGETVQVRRGHVALFDVAGSPKPTDIAYCTTDNDVNVASSGKVLGVVIGVPETGKAWILIEPQEAA